MKMQSYKDVLDEVMPIFHKNPDRFMRFYHAVNNILAAIPEGDRAHPKFLGGNYL